MRFWRVTLDRGRTACFPVFHHAVTILSARTYGKRIIFTFEARIAHLNIAVFSLLPIDVLNQASRDHTGHSLPTTRKRAGMNPPGVEAISLLEAITCLARAA